LSTMTIALDAMSGDSGASVIVPAAIRAAKKHPDLTLILVGDKATLESELAKCKASNHPQLIVHHASEVVAMDELPSIALRSKKDSSMRVAVNLVHEGKAEACVSAGNTGALMATAKFVLKMIPGIDRPAILTALPTVQEGRILRMLDLGANVDSSPEKLQQFAVMGSVVSNLVDKITNPKVALLNNGEEAIKGNEQVKATAQLLEACPAINYVGFIEGTDIYSGNVDVIVCDGFVGNVALKASEGAINLISTYMRDEFTKNLFSRLIGLVTMPIFRQLKRRMDPGRYNGASFVGLRGIAIKSHGGANEVAFAAAIEEAITQVEQNVPQKITSTVAEILKRVTS